MDGPYVPATMPTDQIPLPQDFNYPEPAINMDEGRVWRGGFRHGDGRYLATPDTTEAAWSEIRDVDPEVTDLRPIVDTS